MERIIKYNLTPEEMKEAVKFWLESKQMAVEEIEFIETGSWPVRDYTIEVKQPVFGKEE